MNLNFEMVIDPVYFAVDDKRYIPFRLQKNIAFSHVSFRLQNAFSFLHRRRFGEGRFWPFEEPYDACDTPCLQPINSLQDGVEF